MTTKEELAVMDAEARALSRDLGERMFQYSVARLARRAREGATAEQINDESLLVLTITSSILLGWNMGGAVALTRLTAQKIATMVCEYIPATLVEQRDGEHAAALRREFLRLAREQPELEGLMVH